MSVQSTSSVLLTSVLGLGALPPCAHPARAAEPDPPPGIMEFAGRVARNHWHLFGPDSRDELEAINRELRETNQQQEKAANDAVRLVASHRASAAADRLLNRVRACASVIRIDLSSGRPVAVAGSPFQLPGRSGALLFEVVTEGADLGYSAVAADLSQPKGETSAVAIEMACAGTNYAVVGLGQLPVGRTTLRVEFRRQGRLVAQAPVDVMTPPPGRLRLTVVSDDTGRPSPAMARLMWRTDGLAQPPANALEFAPQFDNQGNATGARRANLPGVLNEPFWCMPGPVDMALEPGEWQVGVRRGVEHEVTFLDMKVVSGETAELSIRPKRWTDMRKLGWWSGDDHVHCRILSDQDARNLMSWVQAEDIHLANVVKMGDIYRTYFEQRGFGPTSRVVEGEYVLSPGQECPRTHDQIGHTLAMNITRMVRNTERYFLYDEVFDAVRSQGGLTGYAHVNSGLFHVPRDMSLNVPRQKVDFVEILQFNSLGTELYYEFLNLGCKLTASAGSDVPWGGTIGEARAYAFLGKQRFSADAWFEAFGRGRTFTTSGPMLEFKVGNALPGDEITLKAESKLRVRARAWGDPKRMAPVKLEIVRHGEVIGTAESTDASHPVAELDLAVDGGHGCWIAARAAAGDGTRAHTTPVYVVRPGLRFWKYETLSELIEKRLASLSQIERLVAEARSLNAEGKLEGDRYRQQLALQGDLLLERVTAARSLYKELNRIAEAEEPLRRR